MFSLLPALLLHFALIILRADASSVRDQHHVTAGRQDPPRWLCYFSLSCDQYFASAAPPPTPLGLQSSVDRHRETLLPQKQRSVYFVVTFFDSQDQSDERKKNRGGGNAAHSTNLLCLGRDKTPFVLGILVSASRFILSLTSGSSSLSERADVGLVPHPHISKAFVQN